MAKIDIIGKRFNNFTVIAEAERKNSRLFWLCQCDCGNFRTCSLNNLNGSHKSCGCLRRKRISVLNKTHGESNNKSKEHRTWLHMKGRCYTVTDHKFANYGGRGIRVCDRWLESFENFLADMGRAPSKKHSLDRRDNNGNYTRDNCHWTTNKNQSNNRRNNIVLHYNGESKTLSQWCEQFKVVYTSAQRRRKSGLSFEEIFLIPYNQRHR